MKVLGVETAGETGSVGVCEHFKTLSEVSFAAALRQGEKLFPAVESALQLACVDRRELGLIAVATGPGSFTGLRIGIGAAKGLAQALAIPLIGVPSADVFARSAGFWRGPVWVMLPDRRDWVYAELIANKVVIEKTQVWPMDGWLARVEADGLQNCLFIGPGAELHQEKIERLHKGAVAAEALNRPSGANVAHLGLERFERAPHDLNEELEPIYLQSMPLDSTEPRKTTKVIQRANS